MVRTSGFDVRHGWGTTTSASTAATRRARRTASSVESVPAAGSSGGDGTSCCRSRTFMFGLSANRGGSPGDKSIGAPPELLAFAGARTIVRAHRLRRNPLGPRLWRVDWRAPTSAAAPRTACRDGSPGPLRRQPAVQRAPPQSPRLSRPAGRGAAEPRSSPRRANCVEPALERGIVLLQQQSGPRRSGQGIPLRRGNPAGQHLGPHAVAKIVRPGVARNPPASQCRGTATPHESRPP
jgi:hypothetical protein